jgi:predicted O-methyltransferase YrrM
MIVQRIKSRLRRWVVDRFETWERLGLHVTPVHYFSPIPATHELPDALFERRSACVGLDWNGAEQARYLREVFPTYAGEITPAENSGLSPVDAAILHAMIRDRRPRRLVEIGGGESTCFSAHAALMNRKDGAPVEMITIEPYPKPELRAGLDGLDRLIERPVQDVDLALFESADLVFIDSSHTVRIGGDVVHEILEIVPRLPSGALVHFHDILLPGEYWPDWVRGKRYFWAEQYLLQAFLAFNRDFEVIWASRYMHLHHAAAIRAVFPYFDAGNDRITSLWIRRR